MPGVRQLSQAEQRMLSDRLDYYEGPSYKQYMQDTAQNRRYFYGEQYTDAELKTRKSAGKDTATVNRLRKILNTIVGIKTAQQPKFQAIPINSDDATLGAVVSKIVDASFYHSNGLETIRTACMNGDRDNIGYLFVDRDSHGRIVFKSLDYTEVIVDPSCKDSLFRTAECIYVVKWMPVEQVKKMFGIDVLNTDRPTTWNNDLYSTKSGKRGAFDLMYDDSKTYVKVYEGYQKEKTITEDGFKTRIKLQTILGYYHVFETELPESIQDYPIIPIFADNVPTPYKIGEVHHLKEIQDYINASLNIMVEGAKINSDPITFMPEDMIDGNTDSISDAIANGNRIIPIKTDPLNPGAKPYTLSGQQINSAFYTLINFFIQELEWQTLPNEMMGYGDQNSKIRQDLFQKREVIMDSLRLSLSHLDSALSQLGTVIVQYSKAFIDPNTIITMVTGGDKFTSFKRLQQLRVDLNNQQSVDMYTKQRLESGALQVEVEKELSDAREDKSVLDSLEYFLDPLVHDYNVQCVSSSYSPNYNLKQFFELVQMRQLGVNINDSRILEKSPIENNKILAQESDMIARLVEQNKTLLEELEFFKSEITKRDDVQVDLEKKMQITEHKFKLKKFEDDQKNKNYVVKKLGSQRVNQMVSDARKDISHEIDITRLKLQQLLKEAGESADEDNSLIDLLQ